MKHVTDNSVAPFQNYRSPLLARPGAAEYRGPDTGLDAAGVAWHYGDPLGEQRTAQASGAVVDRSHRRVIAVQGPDAGAFLNNLLSQKLDDVAEGYAASCLDLDIQGHILHHADVSMVDGVYYLDVPSSQFTTLIEFLTKMVFWSDVEISTPELALLTVLGDASVADTELAVFVRETPWAGLRRQDLAVPRERLEEAVDKLSLPLAGLMAFTAERVRAGEPELGVDLDEKSIPHEAPTLIARSGKPGAVHLQKGCYRGQETVARVENLGRSPRLLVMLQLDGSAPQDPEPGDAVTAGTRRPVGRLGTVVHDCDFGPIALALVKRSALTRPQLEITPVEEAGRSVVSATVDPDSLPADEGEKAGRAAVERLRNQGK